MILVTACLMVTGCPRERDPFSRVTLTTGTERPHGTNEAMVIDAAGKMHFVNLDTFTNHPGMRHGGVYRITEDGVVEPQD